MVVLVVGTGVGLAWRIGSSDHGPSRTMPVRPGTSPTPEAGTTTNTRLVGSVAVSAGDQVQIALVPGGAWLSSWTRGALTRVTAGPVPRVTARVPIGKPDQSVVSMVYAASSLWVVDYSTDTLLALDPTTGRVQRRRVLTAWGGAESVAFGAGSLWVGCSGQLGGSGPRERLLRVDPSTLRVLDVRPLPGAGEDLSVVADAADVWVGGATPLARIDVGSRRVTRFPAGTRPLALNGGTVWAQSDSGLAALDARTGRVLVTHELETVSPVVSDSSGRAWISRPRTGVAIDVLRLTGSLFRFPQYTGRVAAIAVDDDSMWVYTGTRVMVFDIASMSIS